MGTSGTSATSSASNGSITSATNSSITISAKINSTDISASNDCITMITSADNTSDNNNGRNIIATNINITVFRKITIFSEKWPSLKITEILKLLNKITDFRQIRAKKARFRPN